MSSSLKDQREPQNSLLEVSSTEKQLFPLMSSKGILHDDVLEVYREIRTGYEKILLYSDQLVELQEVEYLLWKLHYKHIAEFRKTIVQQSSSNVDNTKNTQHHETVNSQSNYDCHLGGFKLFLSDATKFYMDLIVKLRGSCGLPKEVFRSDENGGSFFTETTKLQKCQFTCHRLLVCLGDLARYAEILKKPDLREWFVAATYYIEATKTWPDSGNPHNQLALLATYVGDAFLALYHCLRSLAIKEPFPDAWRNLVLLFESTSSQLTSCSNEVAFDFLDPSRRSSRINKSLAEDGSPNENKKEKTKNASHEQFHLWPAVIRTISFFIIRSSLEEFPRTFASTLRSLEALLAVDDAELSTRMESYNLTDSSRRGPSRAIQLVSTFIFMIHSLTDSASTGSDQKMQSEDISLALAAVFTCMGRLTERCLKCDLVNCPLLPAVLVFVEWLVGALDEAGAHVADERALNAMSYFSGALSDILNGLDRNDLIISPDSTALWEDHELRGFYPLIRVHDVLDFNKHQEYWEESHKTRSQRIFSAATRIVERSEGSRNWICYDKENEVFYPFKTTKCLFQGEAVDTESGSGFEVKEQSYEQSNGSSRNEDKNSHLRNQKMNTEEEEVILFKPIKRHDSSPLCKVTKDTVYPEVIDVQKTRLDESLRRATTFAIGQQLAEDDSFSFCSTVSNSGENWPLKPLESLQKDPMVHPTGPPSLSGWVLEKVKKDSSKHRLSPINELASISLSDLCTDKRKNPEANQEHFSSVIHSTPPYVAPLPSAPFLPDDAVWLGMNIAGNEADGILGTVPINGYATRVTNRTPVGFSPGVSSLVDGYPPILGMSSSEWLYHYRNSLNVANLTNHTSPSAYCTPTLENFQANQVCRFDFCDEWGNYLVSNPTVYMGIPQLYPNSSIVYGAAEEEQVRDKFFTGYQRSFPYNLCGVGMEIRSEQPPFSPYLKEREWQVQPDLMQARGPPPFIGN